MKTILIAMILCLSSGLYADDYRSREKAAYRYLDVFPVAEQWSQAVDVVASGMSDTPEDQRLIRIMRYHADLNTLEKDIVKILASHLTTLELNALADFYGTKEGRSGLSKLPGVQIDANKMLEKEIGRLLQKAKSG